MESLNDIRKIGAFTGLDSTALNACAGVALRRNLAAGRQVFGQGEPGARFHALVTGWVRISQAGSDGGLAVLRFVGPGEPFGAFGMFDGGCYPGEATAMVPSIELSWSEPQFLDLIYNYPVIAVNLLALAGRRLADVQNRLREAAHLTAGQRVAASLLRLIAPSEDDEAEIPWHLSRKDIAALSATTIYTASRVIALWQRQGIVDAARGRIRIYSISRLVALAEPI